MGGGEKKKIPIIGEVNSKTGRVTYYKKKNKKKDNGVIKVNSFTDLNKEYEINLEEKTCTCPYFQKTSKNWCKHLDAVFKTNKMKRGAGLSSSLLKSSLQKAIRRGKTEKALMYAKDLMDKDEEDFLRRFPIIILEDVILHPETHKITELLKRVSKKRHILNKEDKEMLLGIVYDLSECEVRDNLNVEYDYIYDDELKEASGYLKERNESKLTEHEQKLVDAIIYRSKIGGMKGDIILLKKYADLWTYRFEDGDWDIDSLKKLFPEKRKGVGYDKIKRVKKKDMIPEGVDFHCSPLLSILMKKDWVYTLLKTRFPDKDPKKILQDIIWVMRSSINYKKEIHTGRQRDWFRDTPTRYSKKDVQDYKEIYNKIEEQVESISKWFISKQGD